MTLPWPVCAAATSGLIDVDAAVAVGEVERRAAPARRRRCRRATRPASPRRGGPARARGRGRGRAPASRPGRTPRCRARAPRRPGSRVPSSVGPDAAGDRRVGIDQRVRRAVVQRLGPARSVASPSRTAFSCARLTSAPMRTVSLRGLPTVVFARRAEMASRGGVVRAPRARTRGGSRCTSGPTSPSSRAPPPSPAGRTRRRRRLRRAAAAPQLTLSASMFARTERFATAGCERITAAVSAEPVNETTSNGSSASSSPAEPPQTTESAPGGSTPASITSLHHALREPRGGGGRLHDHRHAGEQRRRGLLPQAPGREVERVDEQRHAARRHLHVLRLWNAVVLAQAHGIAVEQPARVAQRRRRAWRRCRACRCRRRCRPPSRSSPCRCWRWRSRSRRRGWPAASSRSPRAGRRAGDTSGRAAPRRRDSRAKREARGEIEAGRVDADERRAEHGVDERRAGAAARDPCSGEVIGEQFGHGTPRLRGR